MRLLLAIGAGTVAYLAGSMLTVLAVTLALGDRPSKYAIANAGGIILALVASALALWSTRR